jgi:hypothetical protein
MTQRIFFAVLWLLAAGAASADPVTAVATFVTWVNGLSAVGLALLQIGTGLAISAIQKAKARRSARRSSGIQTEVTLDGGDNSESFIIGHYSTAGSWVCPPLSRGSRNRTLTYVVDLGGMAGQQLVGLFLGSDKIEFDGAFDHGVTRTSTGDTYADKVRLSYFDGSQTVAPALLLEQYSDHPDFPWSADMVGRGRCFAIVEFEYDDKVWTGTPTVLFELEGIPLLDPRTGTTVYSDNLAVLAYNVLRGIEFEDGTRWGGDADVEDLPLSVWAAAMNECDRQIDLAEGGSERQFRGGFEVHVDDHEPAEVLERLMDACGGDVAEEGGTWYIQVGAPALPSMFITDDDLIVEQSSEMDPFPGLASTVNGLTMRFPNPEMAWSVSEAERVLRTDLENLDGDRRLLESLNLSACPFPKQVQRVGQAYVEDSRRFLTHKLALPPDAAKLPPLATIAWTSEYNQYSGTLFQIEGKGVSAYDLLTSLQVRETDPSDFSWSVLDELPTRSPSTQVAPPPPYVIEGVEVVPEVIRDSDGTPRRAAILVRGLDPELEGVEWRIQDYSTAIVSSGVATDTGGEILLTEGVLPAQDYFVGLQASGGGRVDWSAWFAVTTYDIRLVMKDISDEVQAAIDDAKSTADAAAEAAADAQADHDALTDGFVGTLDAAFASRDLTLSELQTSVDLHSSLVAGGTSVIRDVTLAGFDATRGWSRWNMGGAVTSVPNTAYPTGISHRFVCAATEFDGLFLRSDREIWDGAENLDHYVIEVDFTLHSGSLSGAGVRLDWDHTTGEAYTQIEFNSMQVSGEVGDVQRASAIHSRPSNYSGVFSRHEVRIFANFTSSVFTPAAKDIEFHRVLIRPATAQEIEQQQVVSGLADVTADLVQNYSTTAQMNSAISAAQTTLQANIDSVSGSVASLSASLSSDYLTAIDTNNAIAAAKTEITAQIGRTNLIRKSDGAGGVGGWVNATSNTDVPTHAPAGAQSLHFTDGVREGPLRAEDVAGRTFQISGWFKSNDLFRAGVRGSTSGDVNGGDMFASSGAMVGPFTTWTYTTFEISIPSTTHSTHWSPAFDVLDGATDWIRSFGLRCVDVTELNDVDEALQGYINQISGLDLNALTGTAFGTLLTQLGVSAGGVSAVITQHASAIADLDGFSSAFLGLTVTTSSGDIAGFRATSWTDPDGSSGSLLELLGSVIKAGTIVAEKLAANAVTSVKIAANAVTAEKIVAGAVTAVKLAANAVTADKIAANAVTATKIASDAVTAAKIAADAVTAEKIEAETITATEIAAEGISKSGVAGGSGSSNSTSWVDVCTFTLSSMPLASNVSGHFEGTLVQSGSTEENGYDSQLRVVVKGVVDTVYSFTMTGNTSVYVHRPIAVANVGTGNITVKLQVRRNGGPSAQVNFNGASLVATAVMR